MEDCPTAILIDLNSPKLSTGTRSPGRQTPRRAAPACKRLQELGVTPLHQGLHTARSRPSTHTTALMDINQPPEAPRSDSLDGYTLDQEQFDFDLSLTPDYSSKSAVDVSGDDVVNQRWRDGEEIFFGPVGHREKCVSRALDDNDVLRPLSPLTADQMARLFTEAQTVASHVKSCGTAEMKTSDAAGNNTVACDPPILNLKQHLIESEIVGHRVTNSSPSTSCKTPRKKAREQSPASEEVPQIAGENVNEEFPPQDVTSSSLCDPTPADVTPSSLCDPTPADVTPSSLCDPTPADVTPSSLCDPTPADLTPSSLCDPAPAKVRPMCSKASTLTTNVVSKPVNDSVQKRSTLDTTPGSKRCGLRRSSSLRLPKSRLPNKGTDNPGSDCVMSSVVKAAIAKKRSADDMDLGLRKAPPKCRAMPHKDVIKPSCLQRKSLAINKTSMTQVVAKGPLKAVTGVLHSQNGDRLLEMPTGSLTTRKSTPSVNTPCRTSNSSRRQKPFDITPIKQDRTIKPKGPLATSPTESTNRPTSSSSLATTPSCNSSHLCPATRRSLLPTPKKNIRHSTISSTSSSVSSTESIRLSASTRAKRTSAQNHQNKENRQMTSPAARLASKLHPLRLGDK